MGALTTADRQIEEAALVVLVPEVEPLVGPLRARHDPSAAVGVPAHITINYPFVPGLQITERLLQTLGELFAGFARFGFRFEKLARFPDVLYLPPEPGEPFDNLINLVAREFPESPPYGGDFETVIPHLTIAQSQDGQLLTTLEDEVAALAGGLLPINLTVERVSLLTNRAGRWGEEQAFPLGETLDA